jgi:DNA topoisomerase-3
VASPIYRRYLQLILGPPPRLYNKYTETVYALPCGGTVKQWTGKKCPVADCNFELCLYTVGSPGRTFPLCPNCFNNPKEDWGVLSVQKDTVNRVDEEDSFKELKLQRLAGRHLTLDCPLPDGHPAITEMAVMQDNENGGYFILDPTSLGAKWRLVSTRGPTTIHMPQGTEKVTVLDKKDEESGCHFIQIDFNAGKSPLQDGSTRRICCLPKDELMLAKIRTFQGSERSSSANRGRGRGHGRRGGGRQGGRGRGGGLR